jgi:septation ring formation regulator EzrA
MLQNNIPQTLPTVEKLMSRLAAAEKSNQKEIRISIQEARNLSIELSIITAKLGNTISEINHSLKRLESSSGNVEVKFDGGGF